MIHNGSEFSPGTAKTPSTPPLSPSHPDQFLLTSVTFTSSVSSHLYSPLCSSSLLNPPFAVPPMMSSATHQLTTPQPPLSPPPSELTPPPIQLLGSDDEEQEDPSDYCRGEYVLCESFKGRRLHSDAHVLQSDSYRLVRLNHLYDIR